MSDQNTQLLSQEAQQRAHIQKLEAENAQLRAEKELALRQVAQGPTHVTNITINGDVHISNTNIFIDQFKASANDFLNKCLTTIPAIVPILRGSYLEVGEALIKSVKETGTVEDRRILDSLLQCNVTVEEGVNQTDVNESIKPIIGDLNKTLHDAIVTAVDAGV